MVDYNLDKKLLYNVLNKLKVYMKQVLSLDKITNENIKEVSNHMTNVINVLNNIIKIVFADVIDLNTELDLEARTNAIKTLLNTLDKELPKPDLVLIEYQMKHNYVTSQLSSQIGYHYVAGNTDVKFNFSSLKPIQIEGTKVVYVNPHFKKNCYFHKSLMHQKFICKYENYNANKKHSEANFVYFCENFGYDMYCGGGKSGKKKVKLNDIADSFVFIAMYIKTYLSS